MPSCTGTSGNKSTDILVTNGTTATTSASGLAGQSLTFYREDCYRGGTNPPTSSQSLVFDTNGNATMTNAGAIQLHLDEAAIIENAIDILSRRLSGSGAAMSSPAAVKSFLTLKLAQEEREIFCALWLDACNRLIVYEAMFFGTLTQTSVYPREVVKAALQHNAASVIVAHNHPSGDPEPSAADRILTEELKRALALVDVRVLDHVIVAGAKALSFAEHGLI